jgi:hypothetical protein
MDMNQDNAAAMNALGLYRSKRVKGNIVVTTLLLLL